MNSIEHRLTWQ